MNLISRFRVDEIATQRLIPTAGQRFEGVAFSSSGKTIGVATADANEVLLFRRQADGLFENSPFASIGKANTGLGYPHDIAFSTYGNCELLAVAHRAGAVAFYKRNSEQQTFGTEPAFQIAGPHSGLFFSDAVAFVPPNDDHVGVCNLEAGTISFYRRISLHPVTFETVPSLELKHPTLNQPDGLAFSPCGRWLAVANHGSHTVSIFQRSLKRRQGVGLIYDHEPVTVIQDPQLRHPHSVAFTPKGRLVVSNAGANFVSVYECRKSFFRKRWSQSPSLQLVPGVERIFRIINSLNKMEGGPKGIAIHRQQLAVCSPEFGLKIYNFSEEWSLPSRSSYPHARAHALTPDDFPPGSVSAEEHAVLRSVVDTLRHTVDELRRANAYAEGQFAELQRYAAGLADSRDEAVNYARSLEVARSEAVGYAQTLEAALDEARSYARTLEAARHEATSYTQALEPAPDKAVE